MGVDVATPKADEEALGEEVGGADEEVVVAEAEGDVEDATAAAGPWALMRPRQRQTRK